MWNYRQFEESCWSHWPYPYQSTKWLFNSMRKEKKLNSLNVVKITYMSRFVAKSTLMLFKKYKNKLKNQKTLWIKMYNNLLIQSFSKKQWHFLVHMRYTGISMKRPQFLLNFFIGIGNLIVILIKILEKAKI